MSTTNVSRYDLHCQSTRSDGALAPAAVVARAAERGVRVLALTDHDEVSGLIEARAAADEHGIELINGVEISVSWRAHTLHIVGLRVDPDNESLVGGLHAVRLGRNERAERMAAALAELGIPDALAGAQSYVTNPELVSRTHFARYLVETGWARSTQAVFDKYLGAGKPGFVPHVWTSLEEALAWIIEAGGVPVIAHPGRYRLSDAEREDLLSRFKALGGVGIEVVTGSHTPDQYDYWAQRAREYALLASIGSDYHGLPDSYRDLGDIPPLPSTCTPIWQSF